MVPVVYGEKEYLSWRRRFTPSSHIWGIYVAAENGKEISELESRFNTSGQNASLGRLNDQSFYALRYESGKPINFPFKGCKFSVLLNFASAIEEQELQRLASQLLEHGAVIAICAGEQAEEMSTVFDHLIDENNFSHDGYTPYSSVEDGLSEALQYFALPTGLTDTSLILTIGSSDDGENALELFDNLFGAELEEILIADTDEDEENFDEDVWLRNAIAEIFVTEEVAL